MPTQEISKLKGHLKFDVFLSSLSSCSDKIFQLYLETRIKLAAIEVENEAEDDDEVILKDVDEYADQLQNIATLARISSSSFDALNNVIKSLIENIAQSFKALTIPIRICCLI